MLLVNPAYARLWVGQAVSTVGDFVFDTTLVLWIGTVLLRDRPYAPAAVSGLLMVVAVATMVVGPLAGVLVDRWDRRRAMLGADAVRAVVVALLAVLAFLPSDLLSPTAMLVVVYAVVAVSTAAGQFFNPARFAFLGAVVPGGADRARAAGIGQATQSLAGIVGPPLAAPLLFAAGFRWALVINAATFVVSFLAVRSVRVATPEREPAEGRPSLWREFVAGLRFVVGSRVLRAIMVAVAVVTVGTGGLSTLNVFFVTDNLHVAAHWYGTLGMAEGAGAVVGALVAGAVCARLGNARVLAVGLILAGLGVVVYARMSLLVAALVVMALLALPVGAINTALTPILLGATPERLLGRVTSVINPVQQLASLFGVAAAGWLASTALHGFRGHVGGLRVGPIDTVFVLDGLLIAAGGFYALLALRGTDRPPSLDPPPVAATAEAAA